MGTVMAGPLASIGELSKPATVLIEKISDAVGGIAKPWQIKRVAKADAEAEIIQAQARLHISEIERRAFDRMMREEGMHQANIESITQKALPYLSEKSEPELIDPDWIAHFFQKARIISNEEMQIIWAKVLSGEANTPGSFSKRTIEMIAVLDKKGAQKLTALGAFCWYLEGQPFAFVDDLDTDFYARSGINFFELSLLDSFGYLQFDSKTTFGTRAGLDSYNVSYFGEHYSLKRPQQESRLTFGHVLLAPPGRELIRICGAEPNPAFKAYWLNRWKNEGYEIASGNP